MANSSHLIPDKAASISVNPTGNISSTNVQDALVELQTDIDGIGGGSGGWEAVQTYDLSVTTFPSSIEITGLSSAYKYMLYFEGLTNSTTGNTVGIQVSTDNGATWKTTTAYQHALSMVSVSGVETKQSGLQTSMLLSGDTTNGSSSSTGLSGTVILSGLQSATHPTQLNMDLIVVDDRTVRGTAYYDVGLSVNAIRIIPSAASLGNEGKLYIKRLAL